MVQLHRSTLLLLALLSAAASGVGVYSQFAHKLNRLQEERDAYYGLVSSSLLASQKSLNFAENYQHALDECLAHKLSMPGTVTAAKGHIARGGMGGPIEKAGSPGAVPAVQREAGAEREGSDLQTPDDDAGALK